MNCVREAHGEQSKHGPVYIEGPANSCISSRKKSGFSEVVKFQGSFPTKSLPLSRPHPCLSVQSALKILSSRTERGVVIGISSLNFVRYFSELLGCANIPGNF